jgi:hypothetical protein
VAECQVPVEWVRRGRRPDFDLLREAGKMAENPLPSPLAGCRRVEWIWPVSPALLPALALVSFPWVADLLGLEVLPVQILPGEKQPRLKATSPPVIGSRVEQAEGVLRRADERSDREEEAKLPGCEGGRSPARLDKDVSGSTKKYRK